MPVLSTLGGASALGFGRNIAVGGVEPVLIQSAKYGFNTSTSFSQSHEIDSTTGSIVCVVCAYDSAGETSYSGALTVNGVSATRQASARFSSGYSERSEIYTLNSPATGNRTIAWSGTSGNQDFALYVFEFNFEILSVESSGIDVDSVTTYPSGTINLPSLSIEQGDFAIHGITAGAVNGDYIQSASFDTFLNIPTTASSSYYCSAAGVTAYPSSSGTIAESYVINANAASNYSYASAIAITPAP